ncbi:hypothetical protein [Methanoregula sp.]|uniref:hypothetical protein n=1 Tax=Methanoregula sp. TaxID=2052170 RepID=UPI000CB40150|nr:hypothetical protein [Methanoregula sp.]PKG31972.1 MAG: hypothetical protein CW742_10605 [Methanoregula sp.]
MESALCTKKPVSHFGAGSTAPQKPVFIVRTAEGKRFEIPSRTLRIIPRDDFRYFEVEYVDGGQKVLACTTPFGLEITLGDGA